MTGWGRLIWDVGSWAVIWLANAATILAVVIFVILPWLYGGFIMVRAVFEALVEVGSGT